MDIYSDPIMDDGIESDIGNTVFFHVQQLYKDSGWGIIIFCVILSNIGLNKS